MRAILDQVAEDRLINIGISPDKNANLRICWAIRIKKATCRLNMIKPKERG